MTDKKHADKTVRLQNEGFYRKETPTGEQPPVDPYSEETVHLVELPNEELEYADHTQVMPARPQQMGYDSGRPAGFGRPQGVQPVEYGSAPVNARSVSRTNSLLIALVCILVIALIAVIAFIVMGMPEKKIAEIPSGPSILSAQVEQKEKSTVAPTQAQPVQNKEADDKKDAKADDKTDSAASYKALFDSYSKIGDYDKKISDLVSMFNSSLTGSMSDRKGLLIQAEALKAELAAAEADMGQQVKVDTYKDQKDKLDNLYKLLSDRTDVVVKSLKISTKYDDASGHSDEILKPFVDAYAPGEQRSKYIKEFEQLYPQAKPQEIK